MVILVTLLFPRKSRCVREGKRATAVWKLVPRSFSRNSRCSLAGVLLVEESKVLPADIQYDVGTAHLFQLGGLSFGINLGHYKYAVPQVREYAVTNLWNPVLFHG